MQERTPPHDAHDAHAERSVLGCCLRCPSALADLAPTLAPADFYRDAHQKIYAAMLTLWSDARPVDVVTVADELHRRRQTADAGYGLLAELWDEQRTGAEAAHYARIVLDYSLRRRLLLVAAEIQRDAETPDGPAETLLERAAAHLSALAGRPASLHTLAAALGEACDEIDRRATEGAGFSGLPLGLPRLDRLVSGLRPGEQCVLAARPSVGKTALAAQVALHAAQSGRPVLFVSLEQPRAELAERLLCADGQVSSYAVRRGELAPHQRERLRESRDRMSPAPFHLADAPAQRVLHVAAAARRLHCRPAGLGLIVVDYLQLVEPDDRRVNRNEQVGTVARRLRDLGRELACPVLLLCQLSRQADGERPRLSHLRDSGEIEQHADCVILLHRPTTAAGRVNNGPEIAVAVEVAKHRNGPTGMAALLFRGEHLRFEDVDPDDIPARLAPNPFPEE